MNIEMIFFLSIVSVFVIKVLSGLHDFDRKAFLSQINISKEIIIFLIVIEISVKLTNEDILEVLKLYCLVVMEF